MTKTIVRQAHKQSWERFISVIKHNVFGKVMAYKVLNRNEREDNIRTLIQPTVQPTHFMKFKMQ